MKNHDRSVPSRLFIFSHARTSSNLLVKILTSHPDLSILEYPFHDAFMWGPEKQTQRNTLQIELVRDLQDAPRMQQETYQRAFDRLEDEMSHLIHQGKTPLVKEHVYFLMKPAKVYGELPPHPDRCLLPSPMVVDKINAAEDETTDQGNSVSTNPTILSDRILNSFAPIFLIRHPALMIPSYYRASKDSIGASVDDADFAMNATFRWSRLLYDWYEMNSSSRSSSSNSERNATALAFTDRNKRKGPIIIDAGDLIQNTQHIVQQICQWANLKDSELKFDWPSDVSKQDTPPDPMIMAFKSTISNSTGVIRSGLDSEAGVAAERARWKDEFGVEIAQALENYVALALPDYQYLWSRRMH